MILVEAEESHGTLPGKNMVLLEKQMKQSMQKSLFLWSVGQVLLRQVCTEEVASDASKFPPLQRRGVTIRPAYIRRQGELILMKIILLLFHLRSFYNYLIFRFKIRRWAIKFSFLVYHYA